MPVARLACLLPDSHARPRLACLLPDSHACCFIIFVVIIKYLNFELKWIESAIATLILPDHNSQLELPFGMSYALPLRCPLGSRWGITIALSIRSYAISHFVHPSPLFSLLILS
jgi:hypothetical protein